MHINNSRNKSFVAFLIVGYGLSSDGTTTFINASTCNLMYRAVNKPVVFDIEVNKTTLNDDESG